MNELIAYANMHSVDFFFYAFSTLAIVFALFVVLGKNPISCAFSLVLVFFCVAANYALLQAHFIAAIQVLVYAGAIMVLFVFVIMLLNADIRNIDLGKSKPFQLTAALMCLALLVLFIFCVRSGGVLSQHDGFSAAKIEGLGGNVQVLSTVMFSDYILPFELTSILLLVGIVGSVALAKRKLTLK